MIWPYILYTLGLICRPDPKCNSSFCHWLLWVSRAAPFLCLQSIQLFTLTYFTQMLWDSLNIWKTKFFEWFTGDECILYYNKAYFLVDTICLLGILFVIGNRSNFKGLIYMRFFYQISVFLWTSTNTVRRTFKEPQGLLMYLTLSDKEMLFH